MNCRNLQGYKIKRKNRWNLVDDEIMTHIHGMHL